MFTLTKIERLSSKKAIDDLFLNGKSKTKFPFKMIYKISEFESDFPARVLFVVPKKNHKRANKRNSIKRRMREVYRLNKPVFYTSIKQNKIDVAFICLTQEELNYSEIETPILNLLNGIKQ